LAATNQTNTAHNPLPQALKTLCSNSAIASTQSSVQQPPFATALHPGPHSTHTMQSMIQGPLAAAARAVQQERGHRHTTDRAHSDQPLTCKLLMQVQQHCRALKRADAVPCCCKNKCCSLTEQCYSDTLTRTTSKQCCGDARRRQSPSITKVHGRNGLASRQCYRCRQCCATVGYNSLRLALCKDETRA
jgi:hypothetical protein